MIVVIMGVAGAGKTAVGEALAARLGWIFVDADDLHPPSNIHKMRTGTPLADADRQPWLTALRQRLRVLQEEGRDVVLACSALTQPFRDALQDGFPNLHYVYLRADLTSLEPRLKERRGHFFHSDLLLSQFQALQEPEEALVLDACQSVGAIVEQVRLYLAGGAGR